MNYLLYLSFGNNLRIECELAYSLISLDRVSSAWSKEHINITIFSDKELEIPKELKGWDINFKILSDAKKNEIIKKYNNHVHVLKPWVLNDFFKKHNGNVMLMDTDTFFIHDPKPLFESIAKGKLILHLKEDSLIHRSAIWKYVKEKELTDSSGNSFKINQDCKMWNSGVVGLNYSKASIIKDVLSMIAQVSNDPQWPQLEFNLIEQTSFSYFFQNENCISVADSFVIHYWFFKPFRLMLAAYYNSFYKNEEIQLMKFLKESKMQKEDFVEIKKDDDLPSFMFKKMKLYPGIHWTLFLDLPASSFIGKKLREEFVEELEGL